MFQKKLDDKLAMENSNDPMEENPTLDMLSQTEVLQKTISNIALVWARLQARLRTMMAHIHARALIASTRSVVAIGMLMNMNHPRSGQLVWGMPIHPRAGLLPLSASMARNAEAVVAMKITLVF